MTIQSKSKMPHYGGQALIEGVLMRGKKYAVAAMRKPDGMIYLEHEKLKGIYTTIFSRIPFFRGLVVLWDSLSLGMKYLTISANVQTGEEDKIEGPAFFLTLVFAIAFAVGLFFILPTLIAELIARLITLNPITSNLLEGIIRLLILVLYVWLIGFSKDISRVFAYHGAEHKTINAFEDSVEMNVGNVKKYPLAHPRCGTSFLLTLVILSVVVFSLLGPMPLWLKIISRILLIPVITMIAYEIIRFISDHLDNPLVAAFSIPNMLLQKLTTREPDEKMIEVAIESLKNLLQLEDVYQLKVE